MPKCHIEIDIPAPRAEVIKAWFDYENRKVWSPQITGYEQITDSFGEIGSRAHFFFNSGLETRYYVEEMTQVNLPNSFSFQTFVPGLGAEFRFDNELISVSDEVTRWVQDGVMKGVSHPNLVLYALWPPKFKNEQIERMNQFKAHVKREYYLKSLEKTTPTAS